MAELPDQRRLWDAYGHAMGAAIGLELLMRIALINAAAKKIIEEKSFDQERRDKALTKIQGMTFGRTVQASKGPSQTSRMMRNFASPSRTLCPCGTISSTDCAKVTSHA